MKHKSKGGRPREFDPEEALEAATAVFWKHSYSGTQVDKVAAAMGMSKPSVYAAFGSKSDIYLATLDSFCEGLLSAVDNASKSKKPAKDTLVDFFEMEIDFYCQDTPPRGCFLFCTAPAETANNPKIQKKLASMIQKIDRGFVKLINQAKEKGELTAELDSESMAVNLQAILQTITIRARAGESAKSLKNVTRKLVENLF